MRIFLAPLVRVPIRGYSISIVSVWRLILMPRLDLGWFSIAFLFYFLLDLAFHLILGQSFKIDEILSTGPGHLLSSSVIISIVVTAINVNNIGTRVASRRRRSRFSNYNLCRFNDFLRFIGHKSAFVDAESWFVRVEYLLFFNPWVILLDWLFFECSELSINPDGQLLEVHPLIEIVVQHIGNNASNALIVMLFHHLQPFRNHIVKDIVVWAVEALAAG